MAATFIGMEVDPNCSTQAVVVLRRRREQIELYDWSCTLRDEQALLEYLAAVAGRSGVMALHQPDDEAARRVMKRIWRVLDYRQCVALGRRMRTRAMVRVSPVDLASSLCGRTEPLEALERTAACFPAVDFMPLLRAVRRFGTQQHRIAGRMLVAAGLCAYAGVWCWWHGPAGYDVLGEGADRYRLSPRIMDLATE